MSDARAPALDCPEATAAIAEVRELFERYGSELKLTDPAARLEHIVSELESTCGYVHSAAELTRGAQLAWRNTPNCLGKAYWKQLHVRDARHASSAEDVFDACVEHLVQATNGGKVRLILTALPPREPGRAGIRIWNSQLVRYAGYRQSDGSVIGDPQTAAFTDFARSLGWPGGPGTPFDVLPLVVQVPDGPPRWFALPDSAVLQVPLRHPDLPWFADLGLRWYAHPAISNQELRLGGLSYTAAPFSGWYTAGEIGARNLSDRSRYNLLPRIAAGLGLDTRSDRTLWKDRALLELLTAVLYSYDAAGVTIVDHHFVSAAFIRHEQREQAAGRDVPARWRSLVAPTAASTTEVFHRDYDETMRLPNFFPQPDLPD